MILADITGWYWLVLTHYRTWAFGFVASSGFPESPAGVGSRLENLRGVGVDPRGPGCPLARARRIVFWIVKTVQVFVSPSNSLRETAVYANSDGKTRWFLLLFHGRPIHCRIGQVSWLVGPPASQARPWVRRNIVKCDTSLAGTLPGRCRGWRGCQPPAAGHQLAGSQPQATAGRIIIPGWCCGRYAGQPAMPAYHRLVLLAGTGWYYWLVLAGITGWYYLLLLAGIIGWYYWSVLAGITGWYYSQVILVGVIGW